MISKSVSATPAKLRDGSWGARIQGTVSVGDTVTITAKSGKSWSARVTSVVWSGQGVTLAATASMDRPTTTVRSYSGRRGGGCHTDGNCSSLCSPETCPCGDGGWFRCC